MVTYIINTSDNKAFDSKNLFSLVGYTRIVWMNKQLNKVNECADEIIERQNALGVDDFRVAVIVDFYNFDKIRHPYGESGFIKDNETVDIAIYFPFIESYLADNLFDKIMRKHLRVHRKDIFYVQNCAVGAIDTINNAKEQTRLILSPVDFDSDEARKNFELRLDKDDEEIIAKKREKSKERKINSLREKYEKEKNIFVSDLDEALNVDRISKEEYKLELKHYEEKRKNEYKEKVAEIDNSYDTFNQFSLHCTKEMDLIFKTEDYPYSGTQLITCNEFYDALINRNITNNRIRRHYYYNPKSTTQIMAVYDTLTLCLYLIKVFEQEEIMEDEGEMTIKGIKPEKLKNSLVKSWNKIAKAQEVAKENKPKYYDVKKIVNVIEKQHIKKELETEKKDETKHSFDQNKVDKISSLNIDQVYKNIKLYTSNKAEQVTEINVENLNNSIIKYQEKRDQKRVDEMDNNFTEEIKNDDYKTNISPSKVTYEKLINTYEAEISSIFKKALKAEYVSVDYSKEDEEADKIYKAYKKHKKLKVNNNSSQFIFSVLIIIMMILPYMFIQRRTFGMFTLESIILYAVHIGVLTFALVTVFGSYKVLYTQKINSDERRLRNCLNKCIDKNNKAIESFQERYDKQLLSIEGYRYIIREIKRIQKINEQIEKRIKEHHLELEKLENNLSSILNNLGVVPVSDKSININNEFNIESPIEDEQNSIYKVFSLEVIEELFEGDGGNNNDY